MMQIHRFGSFTVAALAVLFLTAAASAQDNENCTMCHEDPDLVGERDGNEISVYVDSAKFGASLHGDLECTLCHMDLDGADLPHEDDTEPVDCTMCHDGQVEALADSVHAGASGPACADCHGAHEIRNAAETECASCHPRQSREHAASLHGAAAKRGDELAPTCGDCHGDHDMMASRDPEAPTSTMNIPLLCGTCHREGSPVSNTHEIHQDNILENYSLSIHGEGLFKQGLSVTAVCTSCHTSHNILRHENPESSIHRDNITATCTQCHARIEQVHRKVIEGRLWEEEPGKIPACVDCHQPHEIRRVFYDAGTANQDCMSCHADPNLTMERDGQAISLFVDEGAYALGEHKGTACAQCHTEVSPSSERQCETIVSKVDCSICHAGPVDAYNSSSHGKLYATGDTDAPTCLDCHDKHATLDHLTPTSPTFASNIPDLCGRCHRAGEQAAVRIDSEIPNIVESYYMSIHGHGLAHSGLVVTATCVNCHTTHGELPPDDPASSVHKDNIGSTCGTCHHGIEERFNTSIHATGDPKDDRSLPTCEDCHSSHSIARTDVGDFRFVMMEQCGRCHETEAETFFDTFHGKVTRLGSQGAAKCYDCHGTHNILPTSDPASTLSRDNVVETCASCHPGAHRQFAGYLTHATHHDADKYPYLAIAFWGMTALLVGTLTFALFHTFAWLMRLWLTRDKWKDHKEHIKAQPGEKLYRRFDRTQRMLHIVMIISFFTLSLTGMALKFSYMGWAQGISWLLGGFAAMGTLHRIAAVALFVIFFVHLADVRRRKIAEGKTWKEQIFGKDSILFNKNDLLEVRDSMKWFFGVGPRPHYGRFTYWEKFDYFAVFWGIAIIGGTGLLLWFPEFFTRIVPGWSVNVATIIHSDEALLATAFIFTVHFFNTHFRPDKFPIDTVIFTGRVPVEELKADKPREYEEMVESGEFENRLVDPFPQQAERAFKVFGFIALGIGLTLIALIVYAMLFGYR